MPRFRQATASAGSSFTLRCHRRIGLLVAAAVVEQIAQVVAGPAVLRIAADRRLQHGNLLQAGGEAIVGRVRGGLVVMGLGGGRVAGLLVKPAQRVLAPSAPPPGFALAGGESSKSHGKRAGLQDFDGLGEQPRTGRVVGQVEPRLGVGHCLAIEKVPGPGVQRIEGQRLPQQPFGLF